MKLFAKSVGRFITVPFLLKIYLPTIIIIWITLTERRFKCEQQKLQLQQQELLLLQMRTQMNKHLKKKQGDVTFGELQQALMNT